MRILFYTDTPNVGGAEKQMLLLARRLKDRGHSVSLVYGKYSKIKTMHEAFELVCERVIVLPVLHKHDPRHYSELKKILRDDFFDLLHIHLWNPGAGRYAFFAAGKTPIIATEHDPFKLTGLKRVIKHLCLKKTRQTIVISRENKELLSTYYRVPTDRLQLVHNGIEIERFEQNQIKATLPIQPGDVVLTCIAELHPRKGHLHLMQAYRSLQKAYPHLHLVFVGAGPLQKSFERLFKNDPHVHLLGWREDIPELLKASDIFVLPSHKEAFGLAFIEAMASGVAVIGTDAGGPKDIIENGVSGLLVPPRNAKLLAQAIEKLVQSSNLRQRYAQAAQKRVKELFTAKKMIEGTEVVYGKNL